MKIKTCVLLILASASLDAKSVINLSLAKENVKKYYSSGAFEKEVKKVTQKAWKLFKKLPVTKNSTIVMDIDDTLITSYKQNEECGFGNLLAVSKNFNWARSADLPVMKSVRDLYKKLQKKGFKIVLLTSRPPSVLDATKKNLAKHGYTNYEKVVLKADVYNRHSNGNYKELAREKLIKEGYHIAGCIGDQKSDLAGKHAGIRVKIPNYLYEL